MYKPMDDEQILEIVQPHLPGKGHPYIWATDPAYAKEVGIEVGSRWIMNDVHPEHTVAAARAIEAAATAPLLARIEELESENKLLNSLMRSGEWRGVQKGLEESSERIAELEAALAEASKDAREWFVQRLMNPQRWTREMNDAWCQNIPNLQAAFEALAAITPPPDQPKPDAKAAVEANAEILKGWKS